LDRFTTGRWVLEEGITAAVDIEKLK